MMDEIGEGGGRKRYGLAILCVRANSRPRRDLSCAVVDCRLSRIRLCRRQFVGDSPLRTFKSIAC